MGGDEKNPLFRVSKPIQGQPDRAAPEHLSARVEKCVNHRVPRHEDARGWNPLREEVGACPVRGSEMQKRELGRETAVELFRAPFYRDVARSLSEDGLLVAQSNSPLLV